MEELIHLKSTEKSPVPYTVLTLLSIGITRAQDNGSKSTQLTAEGA